MTAAGLIPRKNGARQAINTAVCKTLLLNNKNPRREKQILHLCTSIAFVITTLDAGHFSGLKYKIP